MSGPKTSRFERLTLTKEPRNNYLPICWSEGS